MAAANAPTHPLRIAASIAPSGSGDAGLGSAKCLGGNGTRWYQVPGAIFGNNMKKKTKSGAKEAKGAGSPSRLIDARIKKLGDWRGETLARVRGLIKDADPDVVEEVKWRKPSNSMLGVPVWEHDGIICTGETYKEVVKMTFARGAALEDPAGLFNSSLEGNTRRAIDIREGDKIDDKALRALIRAAVALNTSTRSWRKTKSA